MKIEFIKETKTNGDVCYYTMTNGYYVNNSLSFDEAKAKELFELIKKDYTALDPKKTVLDTFEIENYEPKA